MVSQVAADVNEAEGPFADPGAELARKVWVCGLPDECEQSALEAFVAERLAGTEASGTVERVVLSDFPGSGTVTLSDPASARLLAAALDGAAFDGAEPRGLVALLESDAAARRAAHARLRDALRMLTGTRSFHNFCPHFHDDSDPKSVRSVYRCRSGMTAGFSAQSEGRDFAILTVTGRSFLYHQILSMMGLVIAVASGEVSREFITLALSSAGGVEVPLAPAGNLVLAECCFKERAFAPTVDGFGAKRQGTALLSDEESRLRLAIDAAVASGALQADFDGFLSELRGVVGPRMVRALESIANRREVPEVKLLPGFSAELSAEQVLEALGDAPRAYSMGSGKNAGLSHRKVAWLAKERGWAATGGSSGPTGAKPLPSLLVMTHGCDSAWRKSSGDWDPPA